MRFPEFSGEWKLTNLNNLYSSYNSLSGKNKIDFENGNSKYVTYLNVFENVKIEKIFSKVRVSNDELQNSILNNDMFVTLSSETPEEVAISSCLNFKIDENIYLNSFCFGLRPKVEVNSLFTAYMIRSPKLRKRIFPLAQGSTRFNLNKEHFLKKLKIYICNKKEQSKIANFLSLIDKRIELQNKIIKDYELLKKEINIKMFTHSAKIPTLRFPEFSGEREKTTLGNISNIKIYQPQTIKPLNFGKYKVFGANGYIGYYKEYNHNTNQVTISCRGGKSGTVNFVESFVWITGNSMVLNLDKTSEIIKKFLYYELIINNVNYLITGSGQPQLTRDSLVQHKIYFPNINEQSKIANFLSKLDEVLLNVKCEKEKLIKIKTFLLQNLFI